MRTFNTIPQPCAQLRPKTQNYDLSVDSGRPYKLDVSMFERIALSQPPPAPVVTLSTQRRMHPSISQLIRVPTLYPNLADAPSMADYPVVGGMKHRLFWLNHEHKEAGEEEESGAQTGSKTNPGEAALVVAIAKYLLFQGYAPNQIAVLTPYVGQVRFGRARTCVHDKLARPFDSS